MQKQWKPDRQGFVTSYLVSGPLAEEYTNDYRDPQQIRYEAYLRSIIADHAPVADTRRILLGENSRLGLPWRVYYNEGSAFVDCSSFYSLMRKVTFDVATALIAEHDLRVRAYVWSYAAVDVYCNGEKLGQIDQPVYKPIQRLELVLPLKAGTNVLYFACRNLGVRDTRSTVALQLLEHTEEICSVLPDAGKNDVIYGAESFLHGLRLEPERLVFPEAAPENTWLHTQRPRKDEDGEIFDPDKIALAGLQEIALPDGVTYVTV